jgi:hypothetical protein
MNDGTHLSQEDLALYVLRSMPEAEFAAARDHVRQCTKCRAETEDMQRALVKYAMTAHRHNPLPPDAANTGAKPLEKKSGWKRMAPFHTAAVSEKAVIQHHFVGAIKTRMHSAITTLRKAFHA